MNSLLKNVKLSHKLLTSFLLVGILPACIIGLVSLNKASNSLKEESLNKLVATRDNKKDQIEHYLENARTDLGVLVENVAVLKEEAFQKFNAVEDQKIAQLQDFFARSKDDVVSGAKSKECEDFFAMFKQYHDDMHTNPEGSLDISTDTYKQLWATCDQYWKRYVDDYGYYDVFMMCAKHGHVLYTHEKESDLGENLGHGRYKDEGLAKLWKKVVETRSMSVVDYSPYSPSNGEQAAFIGAPIYKDGELVAVFALQIPISKINRIMQSRNGLGVSGETYLIGNLDGVTSFRSDLTTMGNGKYVVGYEIHTAYIDRAIETREPFQGIFADSAGKLVLVSTTPMDFGGLNWSFVTKLDFEEAISLKREGQKQDFLTKYADGYGYNDLYLISPQGKVFYSAKHAPDYKTDILTGQYKDTGLGQLVKGVLQKKDLEFSDFAPYAAKNNQPSAFIAQPYLVDRKVELIVALQISLEKINEIMTQRTGMGKTGETILVGPDYLMRSDSFRDPVNHSVINSFKNPQTGKVDTPATRAVHERKETGFLAGMTDYANNKVLLAYTPVDAFGTTWGLNAKVDEKEAYAANKAIRFAIMVTIVITIVAVILLSWVIIRSITQPIKGVSDMLKDIAQGEGDLTKRLEANTNDEIGDMAKWFNTFVEKLRNMIQDIAEKSQVVGSSSTELSAISEEMSGGSQDLSENSHTVASAAEEMSANLNSIVAAMEQTTNNVNMVASATEEMSSTIDEIAKNSELASNVTQNAVAEAKSANIKISALASAAKEITAVTETISAISKQTNLLALNATIEAASAGEAGKGFAVVAGEIKELARQTAQSTEDIRSKIDGIQISTQETISEIDKITEIINESNNLMNTIAAAVSEQSATVREIANNISHASQGMHEVNTNVTQSSSASGEVSSRISDVSQTAATMTHNSEQINASVTELSRLAEDLNHLVNQFKT